MTAWIDTRDVRRFDALYSRHKRRTYGVCLFIIRHRDSAEDAHQETWLKVTRTRSWVATRFIPWVCQVARNCSIDIVRTIRPSVDDPEGELEGISDGVEDQADRVELRLVVEELVTPALEAITPEQRDAWLQHCRDGITAREIAELAGIPLNTAKRRIALATEKLLRHLTDNGVVATDILERA